MSEPLKKLAEFETTISSNVMHGKAAIVTAKGATAIAEVLNAAIDRINELEARVYKLEVARATGALKALEAKYEGHTHECFTPGIIALQHITTPPKLPDNGESSREGR